jgi:hypothetical protein
VHGKRFDYSQTDYVNSRKKLKIACKIHGQFKQSPNSHLNGRGCPNCAKNQTISTAEFISRAKKIHGKKYDYSKVNNTGNKINVKIICKIHGPFNQTPNNHFAGSGCPKCKVDCIKDALSSNTEEFINSANKIHGNIYDYSHVDYTRSRNRVKILCKKHGLFFQKANTHLNGHGCPKCTHRVSKPENEFLDYYRVPTGRRQVRVGKYLVDGFHKNIVYEFLGDWWHGNPAVFNREEIHPFIKKSYGELYKNTLDKIKELKKLGYKVRYIWEKDWNDWKKNRKSMASKILCK